MVIIFVVRIYGCNFEGFSLRYGGFVGFYFVLIYWRVGLVGFLGE